MVDGALWALAVEGGRGDWNVVFALVAAAFWAAAFGTVWLGRGETDGDSELETNERLESAYRALAELVAAFVAERKRRNALNEETAQGGENGGNGETGEISEVGEVREDGRDAASNAGVKIGGNGEIGGVAQDDFAETDAGALNAVDFWREDYWNFDFGLDRDPNAEAEDDPDAWKKGGKDGGAQGPNASSGKNGTGGAFDANGSGVDERDERRRTGNYFGAFFQRRNGGAETGETNDGQGREERPARWKRPKNNGGANVGENERNVESTSGIAQNAKNEKDAKDAASGESGENRGRGENGKNGENGENANARRKRTSEPTDDAVENGNAASSERVFFETDEREPWDDSNGAAEETFDFDSDYNDGALWEDEPDYAFLDDETKSDDEKIAYLKRRIDDGDSGAREELARLLLQTAAEAGRADAGKAFAALDEAEGLVAEMEVDGADPEECRELLGQILLQRPYFYLRNEMTPPIGSANAALAQIRSWAEDASGADARRLLATAWQIQGNCLAALGSSVAALSSLRTAREIFEDLVGEGEKDAEPSLAYVAASMGDAYATIGDLPPAIASFRDALETLEKFEQEPFLAEKVNVLYRLSLALRSRGDEDGAERALREAVDVEERLLAIDEEDYFAPYAQLSTAHAELLLSRGAYEDASAALEQAISTLKIYLTADVALSRRALAYALLDDSLRKRAIARMRAERYRLAACDLEEALEYLTLAMKKGENFDPTRRVLETCALIFDLGVARDVWAFVPETQELVERFVAALTPAERRRAATTYAQLLLQRHVALSKTGRFDEARAATDAAVELLETELNVAADADDENELRLILAKARFQRAVYLAELKEEPLDALSDFEAAVAIYEETRRGGETDETSVAFYLEAVCRRATIRAQAGLPDASKGVREAVREAAALLRRGRWRFLDEAANLSRTTFICALAERDELEALRVVRIWLRYFRRLRRRYVESSWALEFDANETAILQKRRENLETLEKIEAASVDLRRLRVGIVESRDWTPDEARALSVDVESILGRPKETTGENRATGEEKTVGEVATIGENGGFGGFGEIEEIGEEAGKVGEGASETNARAVQSARRFWRRWFDRLREKTQTAQAAEKTENKGKREAGEDAPSEQNEGTLQESTASNEAIERRSERLESARRAFAASTANDPKARALFADLTICVRVVERRLLAGDWGMLSPLSWALDKLTDLYFENGAIWLAAEETVAASRRLEALNPPNDAEILTSWSALWQLQAATLRLAERKIEDGDERFNVADEDNGVENRAWERENGADGANGVDDVGWDDGVNDVDGVNWAKRANEGDGANEVSAAETANVAPRDSRRCETFDAEIEQAFQAAFGASLRATQNDGPGAALSKIRLGEIGAAYLHWLTSKSRGDEAWAFVSAAGEELESRSDFESPIDLFALGGYYSAIGTAADALQRPETLAAFEKVGETLRLETELVGERPEILARRAAIRRRLGALAEARDDVDAAGDLYWSALDDARRYLEESGFDGGVFAIFASLVLYFLREDAKNRGRKAARLARNLEAQAEEKWNEEEQEGAELGFWYINSTAALSSVQTNGSFFVAKERFVRASEALKRSSELAETVAETAPDVKFAEGLFWLRRGFGEPGRAALWEAVDGWARLDDFDPERPTPDSLTARVFIAATLTEERRFAEARKIFEAIYPLAERRALEAAALVKNAGKMRRLGKIGRLSGDEEAELTRSLEGAREFLKAYCILGDFFGTLAADEGRFDVAFRIFAIFRKLARKMRGALGKKDETEKNVWHFWAEAAFKAKKYRFAISAATRSLEGRRLADENEVAFFCEASRIRAEARFERNAWGDRRAAAVDVERSLAAMRVEFAAGRFFLRTEFAETLLLRARLAAARGDFDAARADVERARRLTASSARRGQDRSRRLLVEKIEPLASELAKRRADVESGGER